MLFAARGTLTGAACWHGRSVLARQSCLVPAEFWSIHAFLLARSLTCQTYEQHTNDGSVAPRLSCVPRRRD